MLDKIAKIFGADPTHYRQLLKVERAVTTHTLAEKRQISRANLTLGLTCFVCFIVSASFAVITVIQPLDAFSYALLTLSCTMVMAVLFSLPHFDIILSPTNYLVLAHTPVSSRTYFLVKLTQLLTYAAMLLGSLSLLPAIFGLWTTERNPFFPVIYLPISFIAGFFTIGLMMVFAGYLTKLYTKERLRNIAQYAQLAFAILCPATYLLAPHIFRHFMIDGVITIFKASYLFPNSWFAGAVPLMLGNVDYLFLILTALAVVSTVLLVIVPLRSIAKSYSKYIASLLESRETRRAQLKVKTSVIARLFGKRETKMGAALVSAYLRRDRTTQLRFFPTVGILLIIPVMLFSDSEFYLQWIGKSFTIWLALGVAASFFFIGSSVIGSFLRQIRYSEHWRAAWLFNGAPLAAPHALWRGVQAMALVYIVLPYTLLLTTVATFCWPLFWGGFYLLPGLIGLLCYLVLYPKPRSGLPLSQEYTQSERYVEFILFLCGLLIFGAVLALQFAMYKIHLGLYIGGYGVTVIAGFLIFVYRFYGKMEAPFHRKFYWGRAAF